jgi:glycosyltransferase involved in cell wall biosynthesis
MNINPKISVIIPTYNRASLVSQAIDSVLDQTYQDLEIIIVDDGSTDNTRELLKPYKNKIRYIYQENRGGAAARNTGIKNAKGKYIAFLDSDDLWFPDKLEKQVRILDKNDEIGLVYSNCVNINDSGSFNNVLMKSKRIQSGNIFDALIVGKTGCPLQTWLVRRICFNKVGDFDKEFRTSHDREMLVRIAAEFKVYGIKEPLTIFRQHNITQRLRNTSADNVEKYYFKFTDKLFSSYDNKKISNRIRRKIRSNLNPIFIIYSHYLASVHLRCFIGSENSS